MKNDKALTPRQQEILQFIQRTMEETGAPPTRQEIASTFRFASPNAAEEHLRALQRKGAITLKAGTSRGIRLAVDTAERALSGLAQLCLPLVGRVAAGSPILAQEHVQQNYYVQEGIFSKKPDYLLKVHGESMRDVGIMEGDLLAVQSIAHVQDVRDGQIVVARIDDDVTVKTLRRNRNNTIELHPANPNYEIRVVQPEENFAIEGIAVGLIRNSFFF